MTTRPRDNFDEEEGSMIIYAFNNMAIIWLHPKQQELYDHIIAKAFADSSSHGKHANLLVVVRLINLAILFMYASKMYHFLCFAISRCFKYIKP